jgi:prepilin-type N-terminal cleavage/methylation domain-containing protein
MFSAAPQGSSDRGFSLVEVLLVMMILGSLAAVAVETSGLLQNAAIEACEEANRRMGIVADTAIDAGIGGTVYQNGPHGCGDPAAFASPRPVVFAAPAVAAALLLAVRRR